MNIGTPHCEEVKVAQQYSFNGYFFHSKEEIERLLQDLESSDDEDNSPSELSTIDEENPDEISSSQPPPNRFENRGRLRTIPEEGFYYPSEW
ncbi:MAG: hypothetical protein A2Y14_02900 [Verrucomicrobia bacterium GWF2_51_19]|nr:MAG: hypothetical protein A2Y14_02900 [Verrucomicrobia bacterium GWF2_51_19]HCJ11822.1 hypothetical protein [Opitutae bacterium]